MSSTLLFGSDHRGFDLKCFLIAGISGETYEDVGCYSSGVSVDYPVYAMELASKIKFDLDAKGVLVCGSGQGMCIAANRYNWIRAALCQNPRGAALAREHNDANVIVFGAGFVDHENALECLKVFLSTDFSFEKKHKARINLLGK